MAKSIVSDKQARFDRGDGRMEAPLVAAGSTTQAGLLQLDGNAADIQPDGLTAAAGSTGKAADAGHIHPPASGQYLCTPTQYAPGSQTLLTSTGTTYTAVSSSNINTGNFTVPPSGSFVVDCSCVAQTSVAGDMVGFALLLHGTSTMVGFGFQEQDGTATQPRGVNPKFIVTDQTPGATLNLDLAIGAPGGTVTVFAYGQNTTTPGSNRGAPVTMEVRAI